MDEAVVKKFWDNVEKTNTCWNWKGTLCNTLPIISVGGRKTRKIYQARRVSLDIVGKLIFTTSHVKPLICNNNLCVNPDHLVHGDEARFWANVQKLSKEDCWVWMGTIVGGYGRLTIHKNGKKVPISAHILSWEIYTGRPVPKGLVVCHACDHPYCVRPDHLFLGTIQDNNLDRDQKGRQARGTKTNTSKLIEAQVREIRTLYKSGSSVKQLYQSYGVDKTCIYYIVKRKTWKHITD